MCITSYRLGDGLLCVVCPSELHQESPGAAATLEPYHGYVIWGYAVATLLLHYGYAVTAARRDAVFGYHASQGRINVFTVTTAPWISFSAPIKTGVRCCCQSSWNHKQITKLLPGHDDVRDPQPPFPLDELNSDNSLNEKKRSNLHSCREA